jgi:hypothetical protein
MNKVFAPSRGGSAALLCVLALAGPVSCASKANEGTQAVAERQATPGPIMASITANEWIAAHNTARASAAPAPKPALPALSWNASAAAVAQRWADRCTWKHNPERGKLGEHIFAGTGTYTAAQVVGDWDSEKALYSRATNACQPGKACGHYTQLVWRGTTSVGCAQKACASGSPFGGGHWKLYVCDYSPPGNFVGEKPY